MIERGYLMSYRQKSSVGCLSNSAQRNVATAQLGYEAGTAGRIMTPVYPLKEGLL